VNQLREHESRVREGLVLTRWPHMIRRTDDLVKGGSADAEDLEGQS
jgi:hypothetical protein